jgi:hypothetical protein
MAFWVVRQSLAPLDLDVFTVAAQAVIADIPFVAQTRIATTLTRGGVVTMGNGGRMLQGTGGFIKLHPARLTLIGVIRSTLRRILWTNFPGLFRAPAPSFTG